MTKRPIIISQQPCPECGGHEWHPLGFAHYGPNGGSGPLVDLPFRAELAADGDGWALIDLRSPGEWLWDECATCGIVVQ